MAITRRQFPPGPSPPPHSPRPVRPPAREAQLADSAGVSFESVNHPGRYIRRNGYLARLDPDDNSSTFRADAAFYRTAGPADNSWSSSRSSRVSDRYLRHAGYLLRIDPLGASSRVTDRQDATFRVTS
ncbi:AbfB domain-containing protein [Micromonosporaceae bacterium B7E4]